MVFQPGHKLSPGRALGSRNKRTVEFLEVLEASGFCPATALMDCYRVAMEKFTQEVAKEDSGRISPMESSAAKYLKIAADNAASLASYAYPRLKAIEQIKSNPTDGMTPEQKLKAAEMMVLILKKEVEHGPETPGPSDQ
jgi:hypothetical protein